MLTEGDQAPTFELDGVVDDELTTVALSEHAADRPMLLSFYVYDFSPICTDQMCQIRDMDILTLNDDIAVLGISTDSQYSHRRFAEETDISYPLLSDPDREVYDQYGLVDEDRSPKRGIVVLDSDCVVRYTWEAADNWDEWEEAPMGTVADTLRSLSGD